jgi:hypothetical protein
MSVTFRSTTVRPSRPGLCVRIRISLKRSRGGGAGAAFLGKMGDAIQGRLFFISHILQSLSQWTEPNSLRMLKTVMPRHTNSISVMDKAPDPALGWPLIQESC